MNKFSTAFYRIIEVCIAVAVAALLVAVAVTMKDTSRNAFSYEFACALFGTLLLGITLLFLPISKPWKLFGLLVLAALLRLWFFYRVPTVIFSDYATMYDAAEKLLRGDLSSFHDLGYMARFPHFAPTALYMAGMIFLFPAANLTVMRLLSLALSLWTVYLIYRLSHFFIKSERLRLATCLIAGVYPALVSYSSTFVTENLAMPFFLLAVILLLEHREKTGKSALLWGAATGAVLLWSHLFRGVGEFFLIAFLLYTLLYTGKGKLLRAASMVGSYFLCLILVSSIVTSTGILERPIWQGAEPKTATAALKGSNFEAGGMWNTEDAQFVEEHLGDPELASLCYAKIGERFTSVPLPTLLLFFGDKFISQWYQGDAGGTFWAFAGTDLEYPYPQALPTQLFYGALLLLSLISLLSRRKNAGNMVFWLLLAAFGTLFAVIETQGRYSYIIVWAFILMAGMGLERITELLKQLLSKKEVQE